MDPHQNEVMHIVVIEWDGNKAPSLYYRRVHALSFKVAGDKELSPLARRAGEDGGQGVIMQEGVFLCASESLARQIAGIALDCGAVNVSLGTVQFPGHFTRSVEDAQILDRVEMVLGRRGRKPPEELWAVSCLECLQVSNVTTWQPVSCPTCGGLRIHARRGAVRTFQDPGGDVLSAWRQTRFAGPHWEPAPLSADGQPAPPAGDILNQTEEQWADALAASPHLASVRQMPRQTALAFLDAMFANRSYRTQEARLQTRLTVATAFFMRHGDPMKISLPEPNAPDLVDAGSALGADIVTDWLLRQ